MENTYIGIIWKMETTLFPPPNDYNLYFLFSKQNYI